MQEDYFFHSTVNSPLVAAYFKKFKENNLDCLHLTDQCTVGPFRKNTGIEGVWEIKKGAKYRLSTQAAFWKKDALLSLIRNWESGWLFEHFGTRRTNYLLDKIMAVDQDQIKKDENEILPYVFTGIIKGKWKPEVKELFSENDIQIDFSKRGFHAPGRQPKSSRKRMDLYFNQVASTIDLLKLKWRRYGA